MFGQIHYVETSKQILQLGYNLMSSAIFLFCCSWVKNGIDNKGNPTYKQDEASFLLANFRHLLYEFDEPFVFPSQV